MIRFLIKGIIRDKNRSLLPAIVVGIGVFLTVLLTCWITGVFSDMIDINANFSTGHVKIMTRAYADNVDQMPNDLALLNVDTLMIELGRDYKEMNWVKRIRFGGLMDIAGDNGETRAQGPAAGLAIDLLNPASGEVERLNIIKSIIAGKMPQNRGEALISNDFAVKFKVKPGDQVTLFGSTMNGSMAFKNFKISGTVRFGSTALDRGAIIIDITDAQQALDMDNAAGEILGYFKDRIYNDEKAGLLSSDFNSKFDKNNNEFAPRMFKLKDQNQLQGIIDYADNVSAFMVFVFVFAMSIVLWNTGLLGGLRRYNEFGIRLALGEQKSHIYKTLIYESVIVGTMGSIAGTSIALLFAFWLQEHGIHIGYLMQKSSMMLPQVYRTIITPEAYYIGFIPGLFSMVVGNALSGIGIYKRQTAQLFKELEV